MLETDELHGDRHGLRARLHLFHHRDSRRNSCRRVRMACRSGGMGRLLGRGCDRARRRRTLEVVARAQAQDSDGARHLEVHLACMGSLGIGGVGPHRARDNRSAGHRCDCLGRRGKVAAHPRRDLARRAAVGCCIRSFDLLRCPSCRLTPPCSSGRRHEANHVLISGITLERLARGRHIRLMQSEPIHVVKRMDDPPDFRAAND